MGKNIKINYNNTFSTSHSRDYYRGQSFHFSGEWMIGSHYKSDDYVVDFVVHDQVLLACAKSHLSTLENEPINFIRNNSGTIIGVNSNCWDFIMAGIVGKTGKVYFPTYDDTTGKLTWDLISEEDIDESDTSMYIPMALADLKDDADHRLVTDDEKNAWNDLINQISNLNINKADKADLDDYVKKINNPFAVGSGTQSAFQKNPEHPNTASGNSSVAIGADNEATKIGSFAANRKNHATGDDSNATGYGNTASGDTSHAEGHYTTASGKYSHTEGHGTTASNDGTHAEGWNSKATGDTSHAEGHGSVAGGARSHAEGKYTKTSNDSEHAQGMYNKSNTGTLHSIGIGTSDANRKNAVEVLNNGNVYITGIGNYDGTNPLNDNSLQSLVSTFITKSVNDLVNYFTKTEVTNLINSISQFHYEIYSNLNSINNPQTNVLYLVGPSGDGTDKYEEYVYAVNNFVKIGDTSIDLSNYITIDALNTTLSSYLRISDIPIEKGSGENSVQQKNTDADASGEASVAFNMGSASGEYSFAEGYDTKAFGDNSHAEGEETLASGPDSHAEGGYTQAKGIDSHAEGYSTIANNPREHAEGQFNVSNLKNTTFGNAGNTIHSVGIGTNADNRKNAIEIMQNGDAYLFGLGGYNGTNPDTASTLKQVIDAKGTYIKPSTGIPASDLAAGVIPTVPPIDATPTVNSSNLVTSGGTYSEIHPTIASSQPSGGFLPNVMYNLGVLSGNTTFTLATPVDANIVNHYFWTFDIGSTAPTITWPSGLSWFGGSAPNINISSHYEISVLNNIAVFMEV